MLSPIWIKICATLWKMPKDMDKILGSRLCTYCDSWLFIYFILIFHIFSRLRQFQKKINTETHQKMSLMEHLASSPWFALKLILLIRYLFMNQNLNTEDNLSHMLVSITLEIGALLYWIILIHKSRNTKK